ncbi:MAG: hypothetical protein ACRDBQ_19060 [Shewanella sp.]
MAVVSAKAQLIAIFNAKNLSMSPMLSESDVDFGAPAAYNPGGGDTRNTKLTITAKAGNEHFINSKELHYTREISEGVIGPKALTEDQAGWDTDDKVLVKINADMITVGKTNDGFSVGELTFTRTGGSGEPLVVEVAVKAGHIKYLPGKLATYTITQPIVKVDLSATDGELNEFGSASNPA